MIDLKSLCFISASMITWHTLTECVLIRHRIDLENFSVCPENDKLLYPVKNLKYVRINKTHSALSHDFTTEYDIDDDTGLIITLERWSSGGWIRIPFIPKQKNICKTFMNTDIFRNLWLDTMRDINITHPERCPVPKGHYRLHNHIFNTENMRLSVWSGRFRAKVEVTGPNSKEIMYCLICIIKISETAD